MLGMIDLIISIVFAVFAFIAILWGMNKGRKYRMFLSLSRIVVVAVSTVLAVLASRLTASLLGKLFSAIVMDMLESNSSTRDISAFLGNVPSAPEVLKALIAMIIAPLLFFAFFLAIKVALNRTTGVLCRTFMKLAKVVSVAVFEEDDVKLSRRQRRYREFKSPKSFDPIGALCGGLCGFIVFFIIVIPAICPFGPINNIVQAATGLAKDEPVMQEISAVSDSVANNFATKTVRILGGDLIYDGLTTQKVNGEKMTLRRETEFIGAVGESISAVGDKEISAKEKADAIRQITPALEKTTVIPVVASEILSAASDNWSQGRDFEGIAAPSVGATLDPVVQDLMGIMKDSTADTFRSDVATIVNVAATMIEADALGSLNGDDGALALFKNEELISGVMLELLSNDRLSPMVASFTNLGIGVFADTLSIPDSNEIMYEWFTNKMYEAVTSEYNGGAKETFEHRASLVAKAYDDYGIKLSSGVAECIAASMMHDLNNAGKTQMKNYIGGATVAQSAQSGSSASKPGYVYRADSLIAASNADSGMLSVIKAIESRTSQSVELSALTTVVKSELGKVLSCSDADLTAIAESVASKLHSDISAGKLNYKNATIKDAADLGNKSVRLTRGDLNVEMSSVTDKEKEAKALANVFGSAIDLVDKVTNAGDEIEGVIVSFGPLLDSFTNCQLIGQEVTADLLTAILQSGKVRDNIGLSLIQATDMANTVNNSAKTDGSYVALMKSLGNTVKVIRLTSEKADTSEAVTELIKDITPATAEALKQLATADTVKNYGVPEESAEKVSNMFSDMFGNMADAKESGMSDEEFEKEAAAVSDMMSIAMNATSSESGNAVFGEGSATGVTAEEYLNRATESTVISTTLVNTVYGESDTPTENPLDLDINLNEGEQTELVDALDAKWKEQLESSSDQAANEEYQKVLSSIAAIVNVNVQFTEAGVTLVK